MKRIRTIAIISIIITTLLTLAGCPALFNKPPTISIDDQTVNEGDTLEINLNEFASDPNNDLLSFKKISGVGKIAGEIYSYTPGYDDEGYYVVYITVSDGKETATTSFEIIVENTNRKPNPPTKPWPTNNANNVSINPTLSWDCDDPDNDDLTYDIYFGTSSYPPLKVSDYPTNSYKPEELEGNKTYYWKVKAKDSKGEETTGSIWSFTTMVIEKDLTITTFPDTGLDILINENIYTSPKTMSFEKDETVNIGVITPQYRDRSKYIEGEDTCYLLNQWDDGTKNANRSLKITSDITCTAEMEQEYKVETKTIPEGITTIDGEAWYEKGETHTFTAPDVNGYTFDHWEINDNNEGTNNSISVSVHSPKNIKAYYNHIPSLNIPDQEVNEGEKLEINLNNYAYDLDEDDLSFKLISGVGTLTDSTYIYKPGYDILKEEKEIDSLASTTDFEVTIQVSDGKGGKAQDTFKIKVTDVNRAPSLNIPDQEMNEGETLILDLLNYTTDPDASDTFSYTLLSGVGSVTENSYSYTATYTDEGTKSVSIQVKDNKEGTDICEFIIVVNDINRKPSLNIPDQEVNEGEKLEINLNNYAYDLDEDDLSFKLISGVGTLTDSTYIYKPGYDILKEEKEIDSLASTTDFEVTIQANDGKGGKTQDTFTIEVTDVNRPPSLNIPDQEMTECETLTLDLLDYTTDPDASNTFSYTLLSGVGSVTENSYSYTATYTDAGTKTATIQVEDNKEATDTSMFRIFVVNVNRPPGIPYEPYPPDGSDEQPINISLSWECSDPDGDLISYDIYLDTNSNPTVNGTNIYSNEYNINDLNYETEYFWKVVAKDNNGGITDGPIWSFKTKMKEYSLTITTFPDTGLDILINENTYTSPKTMSFEKDETVNIGVITPQYRDRSKYIEGEDTCYLLNQWDDGTKNANRSLKITSDITCTAEMEQEYKVETKTIPEGITTIDGEAWYEKGETHTFTAPDVNGYTFDHWEINDNNEGTNNSISVSVHSPKKVIAVYSEDVYTLTISSENGSVKKSPDQEVYTYGTEVELEAVADEGYYFDHWEDDLTGSNNPDIVVMNSNKSVTAVFTEEENQKPTVIKVSGPSGTINENSTTFEWSGNDPDGEIVKYEYRKDGGSWHSNGLNTSYTWSEYAGGSHAFEVRGQDNDGAYSDIINWNFMYEPPNQPPTLILEWASGNLLLVEAPCTYPEAGLQYQYQVGAAGDEEAPETATWKIENPNGEVVSEGVILPERFNNSFTEFITIEDLGEDPLGGTYTLTVEAENKYGTKVTKTLEFYVHLNMAAIVDYEFTSGGDILEVVIDLDSKVKVKIFSFKGNIFDCGAEDNVLLYSGEITRKMFSSAKETFVLDLSKLGGDKDYNSLQLILYNSECGEIPCEYCPDDELTIPFSYSDVDLIGPEYVGNTLLISNESPDGNNSESTGDFNYLNDISFDEENYGDEIYKMDAVIPFDHKGKELAFKTMTTEEYNVGDTKTFWTYNFDYSSYEKITATLQYVGTNVEIWANNTNEITIAKAQQLGQEFDNSIWNLINTYFYFPSDVNGDGKVAILCFDIQDGFSGYGGYICGYFSSRDLYSTNYSNEMEIFYIDTYPLMHNPTTDPVDVTKAYSTLAHEFQHMVNYNRNVLIEYGNKMSTWLNEAFSMAAEHIYEGVQTSRISYYNNSSYIKNGHSLFKWGDNNDNLANYSLSYLFGQYLRVQIEQGNNIYKNLLLDYDNNYLCIENAIHEYIDSDLNFGTFITYFRIALLLNEDAGYYGFKGESCFDGISTGLATYIQTTINGGEAFFIDLTEGSYTESGSQGPNIAYAGIFR